MATEVKIDEKNGKLVITIDADFKAKNKSASGKTRIVATTSGNQKCGVKVDGEELILGLNAYIKS